jgi:anti-anti-sigma factor
VAGVPETWRVSKLDVGVRYEEGIPIIEASGECDLITSRRLRAALDSLIDTGHCKIVFDLRNMTYIDSSGFRALLDAKTKVAEKNGDIALVSLTAPVERVFNLLRLGELVIRTDTVEEAVKKLKDLQCA